MACGHKTDGMSGGHGPLVVNRALKNPEVLRDFHRYRATNREYDLPYLGGYSKDGHTVYIDRHLPDTLEYEDRGTKKTFDPIRFITLHETFEKSLIDALGWHYHHAHELATGMEKREVLQAGLSWRHYEGVLNQYIKQTEHEKLQKIPPDLDMTPYYAPPVNRALIAHMEKVMGKGGSKQAKKDVEYSDEGHPSSHCGPVKNWPRGQCMHFQEPNGCELVRGYISPRGWCKLWKNGH